MRIAFKGFWPADFRHLAERPVAQAVALDLLPAWVEDMWIYYESGVPEPAHMKTTPDYGNAKLTLRAAFFEADEAARAGILVHEFSHIHTAPLVVLADDLADEVAKTNEALAERLRTEIHRADERVVTGLEAAFDRARRKQ